MVNQLSHNLMFAWLPQNSFNSFVCKEFTRFYILFSLLFFNVDRNAFFMFILFFLRLHSSQSFLIYYRAF